MKIGVREIEMDKGEIVEKVRGKERVRGKEGNGNRRERKGEKR